MLKSNTNRTFTRFMSLILSLVLMCTMVPLSAVVAYAEDTTNAVTVTTAEDFASKLNNASYNYITLGADMAVGGNLFLNHNLTIDFNGHNLTFTESNVYGFLVYNNATLTLKGKGTLTCEKLGFYLGYAQGSNGYVNLGTDGSEITITATNEYIAYLCFDSKMTVGQNVEMHQESENAGIAIFDNADLDFSGKITAKSNFAIATNGTATTNSTVTILDGAEVTALNDYIAIYQASGTYILKGGTISGGTGIYMRSGNLTVPADSNVTVEGLYNKTSSAGDQTGGAYGTGDALTIDNSDYPAGAPVVSILGGTFYSKRNSAVSSIATVSGQAPIANFINGGRFNTVPANAYLVTGATVSEDADGYYAVTPASAQ